MNNVRNEITNIIRSFLKQEYNVSIDCEIDELYDISNKLAISNIVGYTLNKSNIKNTVFEKSVYKGLTKYELLANTRKQIDSLFQDIKYLYIKGLTISKYYEEPYLRYSSDLDVVIADDDFDKAYNTLINNGYKFISRNSQEVVLIGKNKATIDLHYLFTIEDEKFESLYKNCFNDSHELDINYNYVFCIEHCLKHFKYGILHFKNILDIFYLRKNIDNNKVSELLNEFGLTKFNECLNHYLDCLLGIKEYSDIDRKIEDFIFNYTYDLGKTNRVLIKSYNKSKFSYLLSRAFVPYEIISNEYPILKKNKLLLPIYYVKRVIKWRKVAIREIKGNFRSKATEIEQMHDFMQEIGAID